jgi:uncharacterized membrane protein YkvA (DUF1232 family)
MAGKMRRAAAFTALWKAMVASGGPSVGARFSAVPRMVWQTLMGRYDGGARVLMMLAGTVYVVSPIDLIPEALLLVPGLIDDAFIIAWLVGAFLSETDRFLKWEDGRFTQVVVDADVIDGDVV